MLITSSACAVSIKVWGAEHWSVFVVSFGLNTLHQDVAAHAFRITCFRAASVLGAYVQLVCLLACSLCFSNTLDRSKPESAI